MAGPPLIACRHCDRLHVRAPIEPGALAACVRCGYVLYRRSSVTLHGWIALVLAALITFAIANYFPIASLTLSGMSVEATLPDALVLTWNQGHEIVAVMTGLFSLLLPLLQLLFLLWALMAISAGRLPSDFRFGARVIHALSSWSMIPVLMLAIFVAIVKLSGLAALIVGPGLWAFAVLTFLMTGLSRVTALRLWRYAEDAGLVPVSGSNMAHGHTAAGCLSCGFVQAMQSPPAPACQRCGAKVRLRKPDSVQRTAALAAAAGILYIPANILPVMQVRTPAGITQHTILGGVSELWNMGSLDLALIVFVASVVVPMTKLFALTVLIIKRQWRGAVVQRQRTRLYELVEFIGQWSMLDVFVVILLTAMADFPGITQVTAGPGAASFGVVVILTMLAAMSFDPRAGWDAQASGRAMV